MLLLLTALAVLLNAAPPQFFFDIQLMLGGSMAVLALLLLGWRGLPAGVAGYLVTWQAWGHPFALINGCGWLIALQLFLSRCNGGRDQRGNGRIVLATIGYWLLIGAPAEWLWFRLGLGTSSSEAVALGLKEFVTALINTVLALLLFQGAQWLRPRERRRGFWVRGLTASTLLLAIALPGLLICLLVSSQLQTQALQAHQQAMQNYGLKVAQRRRLLPAPPGLGDIAVRVIQGRQELVNSDPRLFEQLARSYQLDSRTPSQVQRLQLLVPRQRQPLVVANRSSYWLSTISWDGLAISLAQPAGDLIERLAYAALLPSFGTVAVLLVAGALLSELVATLINQQFQSVLGTTQSLGHWGSAAETPVTFIRELNVFARQMRRADLALQASDRRYRQFFNLPLVGTAITSASKGWVDVNAQTCAILGYSREELFTKTWAEITHPDDLAADVAQFERMMRREIDGYQLEKRFIRKDGTVVHTLLAGVAAQLAIKRQI